MEPIYKAQAKFRTEAGLKKVPLVHNQNYKRNGTKSYVYLLNKFCFEPTLPGPYRQVRRISQRGLAPAGFDAPVGGLVQTSKVLVKKDEEAADANTLQTGQITAEDQQYDSMWLSEVTLGDPPQKFMLDFDTGSSDTWVFSSELSSQYKKGHSIYQPHKSNTFKKLDGKTWQIRYGDGSSASGTCGTDLLVLGGLKVENQVIQLADELAPEFAKMTGDGLLGMAFSPINTVQTAGQPDPQNTPVDNMIEQQDIPKDAELFTSAFYSGRDEGDPESFFTFGFIDEELVKNAGEEIHWVDVDKSEGFWSIPSNRFTIAGKQIEQEGNTAIVDTGTTLALVSDKVCDALYKAIPGAKYDQLNQGYTFPISTTADDLPEIKLAVGDKDFVLQKKDIAFAPVDEKMWYGGIQSRGSLTFDILGGAFLKSLYCIWDQGKTRFGCVPKIEEKQNLDAPEIEPNPLSGGGGGQPDETGDGEDPLQSGENEPDETGEKEARPRE